MKEGLLHFIHDIQNGYNGSGVYLTGFEAGTHLLWSFLFEHPENLKAVAPVAGNYIGRCVSSNLSTPPPKKQLPICNFIAEKDDGFGRKGKNYHQFENACRQAQNRGFINISEAEIKGAEYGAQFRFANSPFGIELASGVGIRVIDNRYTDVKNPKPGILTGLYSTNYYRQGVRTTPHIFFSVSFVFNLSPVK